MVNSLDTNGIGYVYRPEQVKFHAPAELMPKSVKDCDVVYLLHDPLANRPTGELQIGTVATKFNVVVVVSGVDNRNPESIFAQQGRKGATFRANLVGAQYNLARRLAA
jgi:hypothetical protein